MHRRSRRPRLSLGTLGIAVMKFAAMDPGWLTPLWFAGVALATLVGAWALGHVYFTHRRTWREMVGRGADWVARRDVVKWLAAPFPRVRRFVVRRLTTSGYLGLHLTVGLALALGGLLLFVNITEDVVGDREIIAFDQRVAENCHRLISPGAVRLMKIVTFFAEPLVITEASLGVAVFLGVRRRWYLLAGWIAAMAGGGLLDVALKMWFKRARPTFENPFVHESTWSFPSGHSMGSMLFYGMLAYMLITLRGGRKRRAPAMRATIVALAVLTIAAIGTSRVFLGAHYFSDVLAGYAAGATWLLVCITGTETVIRARGARESSAVVYAPPASGGS